MIGPYHRCVYGLFCYHPAMESDLAFDGTGQLITHHSDTECSGPCPFHNPSEHHMRTWPLHLREDRAPLMERICPCGIGHPDPDSLAFLGDGWGVHGCCGHCSPTHASPNGDV